jgi:MFS family permease
VTRDHGRPLPGAFWKQWSATAVSNLGDGISFAAMPLLAYSLTDDERLLALTTFATLLPWFVLSIPVGVLVDRADRRNLMVGSSVARVLLFAGVALAVVNDVLSVWVLFALLVVIGVCEVVFDSAAQAFLPMLVAPHDLPRANGYLFAIEVVAGSMAGLSVGAFLYETATGVPFAVNAASFAGAAVLIVSISVAGRPAPTGSAPPASFTSGLTDGFRLLAKDPLLRTLAVMLAVTNLGFMLGQGIFVKFAAVELGVTGSGYGFLLAVAALGAATGGIFGHRVLRRYGTTVGIMVPYAAFAGGQLVIGLSPVTWVVATMGFVLSGAITVWNVVTVSLRQRLIPADSFGRVNSVYRWVGTGASAFGALLGGQIAYHVGLRAPFIVAAVATAIALVLSAGPLVRGVRAAERELQPLDLTPAPPSMT